MNRYALFSDVSLNPGLKLGFGAYLLTHSSALEIPPEGMAQQEFARQIKLRRFDTTSSTKLEVQTLLWALKDFQEGALGSRFGILDVYSDSQCVTGLLRRRGHLEMLGFCNGRTERPLKNACLYRTFYQFYDALGFEVIKVAGHSRSSTHDSIHRIFSFVDKEAGRALRIFMREFPGGATP